MSTNSRIFKRGFIASFGAYPNPKAVPEHWRQRLIGDWRIAVDPLLPVAEQHRGIVNVLIIGYAISIPTKATGDDLAKQLLEAYLLSPNIFQTQLDDCAGRYAVLVFVGNELHVQQDAIGLESVYYADHRYSHPLIASHDRLIARMFGSERSAFAKNNYPSANSLIAPPGTTRCFPEFID